MTLFLVAVVLVELRYRSSGKGRGRSGLPAMTRGHRVFVAATAVLALHVVDDSFLQPNPGTSAGDHLAGGLVPTALLLLGAWAYPRLRAGARAALALAAGVFGLVLSIEALHYTREVGPSGDDYTGLLAIPAGLVLLGAGVATLWHSRRRNDRLWWRYPRRALLAAGTLVPTVLVLFPLSLAYVVTHTARAEVARPELGVSPEEVSFTTSDGLRLEGWFVPSRNGATVIAFPGRTNPQPHARMLVRNGYGVLLFDRRGEGASEGDPNIFGWDGVRDVHAAVNYLARRPDVDPRRIGAIGLSVGGELLLAAAAESDALRAVVSEGASGRSVRDDWANFGGASRFGQITLGAGITAGTAVFSNGAPPPSLRSLVPQIAPRSVFFIYARAVAGEKPPNEAFCAVAGDSKAIWEVPVGGHMDAIEVRPAEYERRVVAFLEHSLLRP